MCSVYILSLSKLTILNIQVNSNQLEMSEVGGIFYLTAFGLCFGIICLLFEEGIATKMYMFK